MALHLQRKRMMFAEFFIQRFRFHMEPKAPLHMPPYNNGNVIRGGFGATFRLSAGHRQGGLCVMGE
jgi:hypothetical protein